MKGGSMKRISGRKAKSSPQMHLDGVPKTKMVGIYYLDRKEVKQALRVIAAKDGHNSLGKVIRSAVRLYLKDRDPDGEWKLAVNAG
jgi:uncharacterized protein YfaQ (DUF2300 family)